MALRIWWKKIWLLPLLTWPTQVYNRFGAGRGPQLYKHWNVNGGDNWGWCYKKWQEHSFVSDNEREVRRQSACIYQKLMCSFSVPLSFSYSYVPHSDSIYLFPKLCPASSGKVACFLNVSLYIILYYSQSSQGCIGIINHGVNWFCIHGSDNRQPTLRSDKDCFIFIFLKRILWQVLRHGHLIFLLFTWRMENNFINPSFVSCSSWKRFIGVRSWYCNNMPVLWVCVDILQRIFSVLMEADNLSQNIGCPHFCESIRNINVKTHRFYNKVARHI